MDAHSGHCLSLTFLTDGDNQVNYQESLELLQQVCNDLLNSQHHRSIAFAAKPKIEEALVSLARCIEKANESDYYREKYSELEDDVLELEDEISGLKSIRLAAEHSKPFEEAIPLKVEDVNMGGGWRKNNGAVPPYDRVDILYKGGGEVINALVNAYFWGKGDSPYCIEYWRPSESAQCNEHSND